MSIQPWKGDQRLCVEPRNPDGSLNVQAIPDVPQPFGDTTLDDLYKAYFRDEPEGVGTWENLSAWLKAKGWTVRPRTW